MKKEKNNNSEQKSELYYAGYILLMGIPYILLCLFKFIHFALIKIPAKPFVVLGIIRVIFLFWLFCFMNEPSYNSFFENGGHKEQTILFFNNIFGSWGNSVIFIFSGLILLNMILQLLIAFGFSHSAAHDHFASTTTQNKFSNIDRALSARDFEMAQLNNYDKVKAMASTGFLTKNQFNNPNMSYEQQKAFEALDIELSQESFSGSLEHLRKLFKGK